jgi:hypothetical protein
MLPWSTDQISVARQTPVHVVLQFLGAYCKRDRDYTPFDPSRRSVRVHVNYGGRDFRFVFTGEKWVNELSAPGVNGGQKARKSGAKRTFGEAWRFCG